MGFEKLQSGSCGRLEDESPAAVGNSGDVLSCLFTGFADFPNH
jgi:hypothetical protein